MPDFDHGASQGQGTPAPGYEPTQTYGSVLGAGSPQGSGSPQGPGSAQGWGSSQGSGTPQAWGSSQSSETPQGWGSSQGSGTPQGYGAPQGYAAQQGYDAQQGYAAQQGYGPPQGGYDPSAPAYGPPAGYYGPGGYGGRQAFQPGTWLLQLPSGARSMVTAFIALGVLFIVGIYVVPFVILVSSASSLQTPTTDPGFTDPLSSAPALPASSEPAAADNGAAAGDAVTRLESAHSTLSDKLSSWESSTTDCSGNLTCITNLDGEAATDFDNFSEALKAIPVPSGQADEKAKLLSDSDTAVSDFNQLSRTTTVKEYQSTVTSSHLQKNLDNFDADYAQLDDDLVANS